MRAACYTRVSRDEQAGNWSLPTQLAACRAHAEKIGAEVVAEFAEDFTGTEIDRPEMTKLLKLVVGRKIDAVICFRPDRLTRGGSYHLGYFVTLFKRSGAQTIFVNEPLEDSADGEILSSVRASGDKREVRKTSEQTQRGIRAKVASGKPIGAAQPPFGLRYKAPQLDERGEHVKGTVRAAYEADPETVEWVRWMMDAADQGMSLRRIGRVLEAAGVLPPYHDRTGATAWHTSTVKAVLTNRCHIGEGASFKVKVERIEGRGKDGGKGTVATRRELDPTGLDPDKAIPLPAGVFPELVSRDLWLRVQSRVAWSKVESSVRPDRNPEIGLLRRGILRCPNCNAAMMVNPGSRGGAQYRCDQKQRHRWGCPGAAIKCDDLDAQVWAWVMAIRNNPRQAAALVERLRGASGDDDPAVAMLAACDARITQLESQRLKMVRRLGTVDDEVVGMVNAEIRRLSDDLNGLAEERLGLAARAADADRKRRDTERAIATLEAVPPALDSLTYSEKRRVLLDLGATVYLYPSSHAPRWMLTFAFDEEIDGRSSSGVGLIGRDGQMVNRVFNPEFRGGGDEAIYDTEEVGNVSHRSGYSHPHG